MSENKTTEYVSKAFNDFHILHVHTHSLVLNLKLLISSKGLTLQSTFHLLSRIYLFITINRKLWQFVSGCSERP